MRMSPRMGPVKIAKHMSVAVIPKGPCAQIVYTLGPKYPNREYFKGKVYNTIWAHGPVGYISEIEQRRRESSRRPRHP